MKEYPKNIQENVTGGGKNHLYVINGCQEQEDSRDGITRMIQVFGFITYALLDLEASYLL